MEDDSLKVRFRRKSRTRSPKKHAGEQRAGLARALSKLGYCSRSRAVAMIQEGRVCLNGAVVSNPEAAVRLKHDEILVDGERVGAAKKVYLVLNKPRGVVTTAADEKDRKTVYDLLPQGLPWIGPVGRLDQASEGLLLLTNDTHWANRITAPETHLDKTYHVQIASVAGEELLETLQRGVKTDDGVLRVKRAAIVRAGAKHTWLEIALEEGKNRQIRRMLNAQGIEVLRLIRIAVGPLALGDLPKRSSRNLTPEEKQALDHAIGRANLRGFC